MLWFVQVRLVLACLGMPDLDSNNSLGYPLSDDALQFLKTELIPEGECRKANF